MDNKSYILLINREQKFLADIRQSLTDAGFPVLTTTTMSQALKLLSGNSVRLIICDNVLEAFSGYEFLRFLKKNPLLKKIPFVFFVPVYDQGSAGEAFNLGAVDFIVYPLDMKIFLERIGKILSLNESHDEISTLPKEKIEESSPSPVELVSPEQEDRRRSERIDSSSDMHIEISRDAILWMPGQIKNVNKQGFLIETPLLGRLGIPVYIRVPMPDGKCVIEGQIRHISLSNHQLAADIGVEIKDSPEWTDIYNYIVSQPDAEEETKSEEAAPVITIPEAKEVNESTMQINSDTVLLTSFSPLGRALESLHNLNDAQQSGKALETRFYQSLVGKQLGNYKAVSLIGAGAMGGVFKGWDVILERNVALKIISYKLSSIASFREMFVKEARLISRLHHPNIAEIYYIDQTDDVMYFAMELINGNTLKDMIKESSNLNTSKGLEYFLTTCRTLDFVSKENIIHRDIKPENIMINDKGMLKVVDFGVAVVNDGESTKGKSDGVVGSPYYVSPDCIRGRSLDSRSDIYSLGATFYHVFSGSPPFEGNNVEEVLRKHLHDNLIPLKKKNPTISSELSDIINKMMAKDPLDRYQNYQAIIDDLTTIMN